MTWTESAILRLRHVLGKIAVGKKVTRHLRKLFLVSVVVCFMLILPLAIPAHGVSGLASGQKASTVVGQSDFKSIFFATSPRFLSCGFFGCKSTFDSSGDLWVADTSNNRVLEFKPPFANSENASLVIGQSSLTRFNGTAAFLPSQKSLSSPQGLAFDNSGNLWVADSGNNRVLEFAPPFTNGMLASRVIGQSSFTTSFSATSQSNMSFTTGGITFDSSGNLWVADSGNNRVLEFAPPFTNGMLASRVIGQSSFTTSFSATSQSNMSFPDRITFDNSGNLWVVDSGNNRVLEFTPPFANGMNAALVIGQSNFINSFFRTSQDGLAFPGGITFDSAGNLWVADTDNYRVLEFQPSFTNGENASLVIGQSSFTTSFFATSQSNMSVPQGVAFDNSGNLWVADSGNNRVLEFAPPFTNGMLASRVIGQLSFTTKVFFVASESLTNLPTGVAVDSAGDLWVADTINNRVLEFKPPFSDGENASLVIGQSSFATNNFATSQQSLSFPGGITFDSSGDLWVADSGNNRVLEFRPPFTNGMLASVVIGQSSFTTSFSATSQSNMSFPQGVAFDNSGNLWVADSGNSRVLEFRPSFTNGMLAYRVIGQSSFTTSFFATSQSNMSFPNGITFDKSGNLWVADLGNSRVLEFQPSFTNGESATIVIGQSSFKSATPTTTQHGLSFPTDVTVDSAGNLWVADSGNSRVLEFQPSFSSNMFASLVIGQSNFTTSFFATSQSNMSFPNGITFDKSGNLWVADSGNNRVLEFSLPTVPVSITLIADSGSNTISSSNYFTVTYTSGGVLQKVHATTGTLTFQADQSSTVTISPTSSASSNTEEWCLAITGPQGTCTPTSFSVGSTAVSETYYYYDLLSQSVSYSAVYGGSPSVALSGMTAPSTAGGTDTPASGSVSLSTPAQVVWGLRGSTASVPATVPGATNERWATGTTSWSINGANVIPSSINYYNQYYNTFGETVSTGTALGSSNYVTVTYTNLGVSTTSSAIYGSTYFVGWTDANIVTFSSTSSGSSTNDKWSCSSGCSVTPTSGGNTYSATYVEQVSSSSSSSSSTTSTPTTTTSSSVGGSVSNLPLPVIAVAGAAIAVAAVAVLLMMRRKKKTVVIGPEEEKST